MGLISSSSMKVLQFARGFIDWDRHEPSDQQLALGAFCKRLRPLAPRLSSISSAADSTLDLKSFIRPESCPIQLALLPSSHHDSKRDARTTHHQPQVETHPGGTRWNPTQEQIGILETLYRGGMRTPNAHQIEQITAQLAKYGKIEGKNVFYWFQNHKARERQKLKRNNLGLSHCPRNAPVPSRSTSTSRQAASSEEVSPYKRKCRSRRFESLDEEGDKTLELFPLHPQGGR